MSSTSSIFIVVQLDTNLNLIAGRFVNEALSLQPMELIYQRDLELDSGNVRLYTVFESMWEELLQNIESSYKHNDKTLLFLVGPHAGFTNSRIVYMWLRSHKMFSPQSKIAITKVSQNYSQSEFTKEAIDSLVDQSSPNLLYSKEPRIGTK